MFMNEKKICANCYYFNVDGRAGYIVCSNCAQHSKWKKSETVKSSGGMQK